MADRSVPGPVTDAMVFHDWQSSKTLTPYMSPGHRQWIERPQDAAGPLPLRANWLYRHPGQAKQAPPAHIGGRPGATLEALQEQLLGKGDRARVVLGYDDALLTTAEPMHYGGRAFVRAANEWTVDQWLERDPRLFGLILIPTALPDEAAAEIRHFGRHERMVGVALGMNALMVPFGNPAYHPIYRAAEEMDLPVVLQVGSDASVLHSSPLGGGPPASFGEYHALGAHSHMTHVASMIMESVFDLFPRLRVLLVGGGLTWLPAYLWRLDYWFKMEQAEVPWVRRLPSEYFAEHFRVTTYSLETFEKPERLAQALTAMPELGSLLLYASGYPNSDAEEPESVAARLPDDWHAGVFGGNADSFFRWPDRGRPAHRDPLVDRQDLFERPVSGPA